MSFDLKAWLFQSSSFCCCIPVRAGVVSMSILTFLLSGAISVIIWFEVFHSYEFSSKERVAFILTGIVESILFSVSIIGFIGVVARKQLFVMIYTYFLYVHLVLNLIVGIYFLITVRMSNRQQLVDYCAQVFVNTSTELDSIVIFLLLIELYGVLIATRYVHRLRMQKRDIRSRRLGYFHALSIPEPPTAQHTRQESDSIELLHSRQSTGSTFVYTDPYDFEDVLDIRPQPSTNYVPLSTHDRDLPPLPKPSPSLSQRTISSDTSSGRRIRALPPRPTPNATSQTVTYAPSWPPGRTEHQRRPPPNSNPPTSYPHANREPLSPESEDERQSLYTAEVSTNAHAALMDHAAYMRTVFTPPSNAPPVPRLPPPYTESRHPLQ
ncbi:hypothetical protein BS17DRAFT_764653 [Gyrodon lividus]|nr:hypothetical protein BS17DRAFT_764653 [Gyrodon lividus]